MPQSRNPEIHELPIFRDMKDDNFDLLMQHATVETFPPLKELIREGESSDVLVM